MAVIELVDYTEAPAKHQKTGKQDRAKRVRGSKKTTESQAEA
jgi:large subunit ribosomal protein L17